LIRFTDIFLDPLHVADLAKHVESSFVGAAVRRAPQAGDAGGDTGEWVGARRSGQADGRGGRILLMVGVEDENPAHRIFDHRIDFIWLRRDPERHAQEVACVAKAVVGVEEWLADRIFERHCCNRRHLGDQAVRSDQPLLRIGDIGAVVIEGT
jgi:hypothetical protein